MDEISDQDPGSQDDVSIAPPKRSVKDLLGSEEFDKWGVGVHFGIPEDVYHALPAVSSSSMKHARRSFRHFQYYVEGGEYLDTPKKAFGRISHRALLEYERFKETCIFSDFADKRSKAYKEMVKANPDKDVLTAKESKQLTAMFTELSLSEPCMDLIKEGRPEVTILAIDPVTKLRLKCRIDWVSIDRPFLLDYKTTEDARPTELPDSLDATKSIRSSKFERNANTLGYENQAAFYLWMSELAGIKKQFFAVIAQEIKPPFVPCAYVYGFETVDEAAGENRETLNRIKDAIDVGKFPGYSDKPVVLARPTYARK